MNELFTLLTLTHLSSCGFRARLSADLPDQTQKLLSDSISLDLPALKNNPNEVQHAEFNTSYRSHKVNNNNHTYFLYEDKEVVQLLAVELDGCCGDDGVDVLDDSGGLARLQAGESENGVNNMLRT